MNTFSQVIDKETSWGVVDLANTIKETLQELSQNY